MANEENVNILIVDDKINNLIALEALLEDDDRNILTAMSGNEALGLMLEHDFALVILDIQMPEMDGIETAGLMRKNAKTRQTPIIFVTAINKDRRHVFQGYNAGAVDYIFKPVEPIILKSKVEVLIQLYRQRKTIERTNSQLQKMVCNLETANRKILHRYKAQIEEERLKVILQLAGATACEMNQPLMQLLDSIDLLTENENHSTRRSALFNQIKKSGKQIYQIARRIQSMPINDSSFCVNRKSSLKKNHQLNILSLSGSKDDFKSFNQAVQNGHLMNFHHAGSIKEAFSLLSREKMDIIITDYHLTDGTGFDMMDVLKEKNLNIPVVFITGNGDEIIAAKAIKQGAYDYLTREALSEKLLFATLSNALEKMNLQKEIEAAYQRLTVLSTKDGLTKLYNRRYFNEAVESEISKVKRYGSAMSMAMIDLDHFKTVNDRYGHLAGDKVLSKTAGILSDLVRECDIVCRYGGEEFGLILPKTYSNDAFLLGERIRKSIEAHTYEYDKNDIGITVSIGISSYNQEMDHSLSAFINQADKALYAAKSNGRNRVELFAD